MLPWIECPHVTVPLKGDYATVAIGDGLLASSRRLLDAIRAEIPAYARPAAYALHTRTLGRYFREVRGIARRADADWRDVTLANLMYDFVVARFGCSTVALATPDGPVLARNMDWWPEDLLAQASCHLHFEAAGVSQFSCAAWPGGIGVVTGLSRRGFALALNAVLAAERFDLRGHPVLFFLRRVLEDAKDFAQAVVWCAAQRLMAPALITLVGLSNDERVVVERTPTRHAFRRPLGNAPLITTNDYRLLEPPQANASLEIYQTTCHRYETLETLLAARAFPRPVPDEEILFALTDPRVLQTITAQHVVMRPRLQSLRLFVPRELVA